MGLTQKCWIIKRSTLKVAHLHPPEKTASTGCSHFTEEPRLFQPNRLLQHEEEELIPDSHETQAACSSYLEMDNLMH